MNGERSCQLAKTVGIMVGRGSRRWIGGIYSMMMRCIFKFVYLTETIGYCLSLLHHTPVVRIRSLISCFMWFLLADPPTADDVYFVVVCCV